MLMRSALIACAALCAIAAQPALADNANARCEATNLRVYYRAGSAALNSAAREMLAAAQRNMADCSYAELHVSVDPANTVARARGRAIIAAMHARAWNVAVLEPRAMTQRVAYSASPDYVELLLTPEHLQVREMPPTANPNIGA